MMSKRVCAAVTLALGLAATCTAAADEMDGDRCAIAENHMRRYIRVVKSCSEAAFVRRDIDEADALCRVANPAIPDRPKFIATLLDEDNDPTSDTARYGCVRDRIRPLMPDFLKSLRWAIAYSEVLRDGKGKDTFGPLDVHPPGR